MRALGLRLASEQVLRLSLLAILILAALPFGCSEDLWRWLLITILGLVFVLFLWTGAPIVVGRREKLGLQLGCAYMLWLGFQMVPMPPSVLARLSPEAHRLYQVALPEVGAGDPIGYAYPDPGSLDEPATGASSWVTPAFGSLRTISLYPYGTYRNFFQTAVLLGFVLMGISLFRDRRHRQWLALTIVGVAVFEAAYGSLEALTGHQHIFWYAKRFYTESATGTLVNRNHYAALLNMALPLMVVLLLDRRQRVWTPLRFSTARRRLEQAAAAFREPFLLSISIVTGIAVVLSRSRMGLAATLSGLLCLGVLLAWQGRRWLPSGSSRGELLQSRWVWAFPPLLFLGICLYSLGTDAIPTMQRFLQVGGDLHSGAMRPALWGESLQVIRSYIWTGAGSGAYPHAVNPALARLALADFWQFDHAHNDYLETLATLGLAGTLLAAAAIAVLGLRRPGSLLALAAMAGLASLVVHSAVDFPLVIPANALLACALLCLIAVPDPDAEAQPRVSHGPRASRRALACAVGLVVVLWPGRAALAGVVAGVQGTPGSPAALRALRIASALDPWNDQHVRHLAQALPAKPLTEAPGGLVLGGSLSQQARRLRLERLAALAEGHRQLLRCLDRSPVDFTLHADIARSASYIRTIARECGIPPPDDVEGITSPHRASVALAPTAYENQIAMAALLWKERGELGEPASSLALDLVRDLHDRLQLRPEWRTDLVRMTDDGPSLVRVDQAARPYPDAYDDLVSPQARDASPVLAACAGALRTQSTLREARDVIDHAGRDAADRGRLGSMRGMLESVITRVNQAAPADGSEGTCGGVLRSGDVGEEARQLLTSLERKLADPS